MAPNEKRMRLTMVLLKAYAARKAEPTSYPVPVVGAVAAA